MKVFTYAFTEADLNNVSDGYFQFQPKLIDVFNLVNDTIINTINSYNLFHRTPLTHTITRQRRQWYRWGCLYLLQTSSSSFFIVGTSQTLTHMIVQSQIYIDICIVVEPISKDIGMSFELDKCYNFYIKHDMIDDCGPSQATIGWSY